MLDSGTDADLPSSDLRHTAPNAPAAEPSGDVEECSKALGDRVGGAGWVGCVAAVLVSGGAGEVEDLGAVGAGVDGRGPAGEFFGAAAALAHADERALLG